MKIGLMVLEEKTDLIHVYSQRARADNPHSKVKIFIVHVNEKFYCFNPIL